MAEIRLICPNCGTEYRLDEAAIPSTGRVVECGNCGKVWRQPKATARPSPTDTPENKSVSVLATALAQAERKAKPASTDHGTADATAAASSPPATEQPQPISREPATRPARPQPAADWPPNKISPKRSTPPAPRQQPDRPANTTAPKRVDSTPEQTVTAARSSASPATQTTSDTRRHTAEGVKLNRPLPSDVFDILTQEAAREAQNRQSGAAPAKAQAQADPVTPPHKPAPKPAGAASHSDSIDWPSGKGNTSAETVPLPTNLVGAMRHIHARPQQPPAQPEPGEMAAKVTRTTPNRARGNIPDAAPVPPLAADALAHPPHDDTAPPAPTRTAALHTAPETAPAQAHPPQPTPQPAARPRAHPHRTGRRGFTAAVLLAAAALALYLAAPLLADQQPWGPKLMALHDQIDQGRLWLFHHATALVDPLIARLTQPGK